MTITVHFRGVGVFVPSGPTTIKELLFPDAETRNPPDHETGSGGEIQHADKSQARKHYTGALVLSKTEPPRHTKLNRRRVDFPSGGPTSIDPAFGDSFPSITRATSTPECRLRLLPEAEREKSGRVATRIIFSGGQLDAAVPKTGFQFDMDGECGAPTPKRFYAIDSTWTTDATSVTLGVKRMADGGAEADIVLDADHDVAYFYSFDHEFPTKKQLTDEHPSECKPHMVDHDFKWIYQLLDRLDGSKRWQDWLHGRNFPAPRTDCLGEPLIHVSTCFHTFWDGA